MMAYEVVNSMRQMTVTPGINLEEFHRRYGGKIYLGRPEMIVNRLTNNRNIQAFRSGRIQILGGITMGEAERMVDEFVCKLKVIQPLTQASKLQTMNMVVKAKMNYPVRLRNIQSSDSESSYETEIFPALLISKWSPIHISLFHTGHYIVTGIKSEQCLRQVQHDLLSYLYEKNICMYPPKRNKSELYH